MITQSETMRTVPETRHHLARVKKSQKLVMMSRHLSGRLTKLLQFSLSNDYSGHFYKKDKTHCELRQSVNRPVKTF